jgi:probable rRNA maturation factor
VSAEVTTRPGVAPLLDEAECARILESAVRAGGAPVGARVALTLSDDAELARLNEQHMGKAGPTDVLSFPLLPPSRFPAHAGQDAALREAIDVFPLPPGQAQHLGDIIVSVERAIQQAETGTGGQTSDVRWAPADELRLLIIHGGLHLCGWDHADPVEAAAMRALERRLVGSDAAASVLE